MHNTHLRSRKLCSISLRLECLHKLFEIFYMEDLSIPFIYSVICISIDSDFHFILWITQYSYVSCCSNYSDFGLWKLFRWLLGPFDLSHHYVCFWFFLSSICYPQWMPYILYFVHSIMHILFISEVGTTNNILQL